MTTKIDHDPARRRFAARVERGEAVLDYELADGGNTLDLTRTFVSEELRGEGLAGRVVQHALDWARHHDKRVIATCPYVKSWVERHPEYGDLLARPATTASAVPGQTSSA